MKRILICLFFFSACSSYQQGFHHDKVRAASGAPPLVIDESIRQALAKKPQLPKPFRLGIYWREPVALLGGGAPETGRFSVDEKQALLHWAQALPRGEVGNMIPISVDEGGRGSDLRAIRLASARHGADAVLVVSGAAENLVQANDLALTYLLLLPTLFVRGTDVSTLFLARASLWDVRNEYLYMSAEAEAEDKRARPALAKGAEAQAAATRKEAFARLLSELRVQFVGLLGRAS